MKTSVENADKSQSHTRKARIGEAMLHIDYDVQNISYDVRDIIDEEVMNDLQSLFGYQPYNPKRLEPMSPEEMMLDG